ncbi:MAG: hypothetical protein P8170_15115 [Gemmatimonadota bacterium]
MGRRKRKLSSAKKNADPIFFHQEGLSGSLEPEESSDPLVRSSPALTPEGRELVSFITTDDGDDLIVAYAVELEEPGEIASLILLRTPKYEGFLRPEERGVQVSHELHSDVEDELLLSIVVDGLQVDIETTVGGYRLDLSRVDRGEIEATTAVLRRMRRYGGFELDLR